MQSINSIPINSFEEAMKLIKAASRPITFTLSRKPTLLTITFPGEEDGEGACVAGPLGMTLHRDKRSGRAVVSKVASGGAARSNGVKVRDCIEVRNKDVQGLTTTSSSYMYPIYFVAC